MRSRSRNRITTAKSSTAVSRCPVPGWKLKVSKTGLNTFGAIASTITPAAIVVEMMRLRRLIRRRRYRPTEATKKATASRPPITRRASIAPSLSARSGSRAPEDSKASGPARDGGRAARRRPDRERDEDR